MPADPETENYKAAKKLVYDLYNEIEPKYRADSHKLTSADLSRLINAYASVTWEIYKDENVKLLHDRQRSINPIESDIAKRLVEKLSSEEAH